MKTRVKVGLLVGLSIALMISCASAGLRVKQARVAALEAATGVALHVQAAEIGLYARGVVPADKHAAIQGQFAEFFALLELRRQALADWNGGLIPAPTLEDLITKLEHLRDRLLELIPDANPPEGEPPPGPPPAVQALIREMVERLERAIAVLRRAAGHGQGG